MQSGVKNMSTGPRTETVVDDRETSVVECSHSLVSQESKRSMSGLVSACLIAGLIGSNS